MSNRNFNPANFFHLAIAAVLSFWLVCIPASAASHTPDYSPIPEHHLTSQHTPSHPIFQTHDNGNYHQFHYDSADSHFKKPPKPHNRHRSHRYRYQYEYPRYGNYGGYIGGYYGYRNSSDNDRFFGTLAGAAIGYYLANDLFRW